MRLKFLFVSLCLCFQSFSQEKEFEIPASSAPNIFIELGGNGLFLSANYDQRFNKTGKGLGFRAGLGFVPGFGFGFGEISTLFTIPVGLNYLVGNGPHHFEVGAGATYVSGNINVFGEDEDASGVAFVPNVAYRYQKLGKGFTGRISISPLVGGGGMSFYFGISGGIRLR